MPAGTYSWRGDAALPSSRPGAREAGEGPLEAGLLPLTAPRPPSGEEAWSSEPGAQHVNADLVCN